MNNKELEKIKSIVAIHFGALGFLNPSENEQILKDRDKVLNALTELQSIKETKPSEALECLEEIENYCEWSEFNSCLSHDFPKEYNTIKQALLKAQEQEKVLSIIKEKNVDIKFLRALINSDSEYTRKNALKTYNLCLDSKQLTQQEFDLLKRWLG